MIYNNNSKSELLFLCRLKKAEGNVLLAEVQGATPRCSSLNDCRGLIFSQCIFPTRPTVIQLYCYGWAGGCFHWPLSFTEYMVINLFSL